MWRQLKQTFDRWNKDDGSLLAAAVAYYAALSLFPVLLLLISGIGLFLEWTSLGQTAEQEVLAAIGEQVSPTLEEQVRQTIGQVRQNATVGGPVGAATLLFSALVIFAQFEKAFDRIWNVERETASGLIDSAKRILFYRLRAFLMLLGLGAIVGIVFIAGLALSATKAFANVLPLGWWTWWFVQTGTTMVLNAAVFTVIYAVLPRVRVRWAEALRGGILAAVVWEVGRQLLGSYVISDKYDAYGVVGSMLAIILWIYYAVTVVFLGAEYIQVIRQYATTKS